MGGPTGVNPGEEKKKKNGNKKKACLGGVLVKNAGDTWERGKVKVRVRGGGKKPTTIFLRECQRPKGERLTQSFKERRFGHKKNPKRKKKKVGGE